VDAKRNFAVSYECSLKGKLKTLSFGSETLCLYYTFFALGNAWRKVLANSLGCRGLRMMSALSLAECGREGLTQVLDDRRVPSFQAVYCATIQGLLNKTTVGAKTMPSLGIVLAW